MFEVNLIPTGADATMTPSTYVNPETLQEGDPQEHEQTHLCSGDEKFTVGTWRAEPYSEYVDCYPCDEYTRVLEGSVTLTHEDGVSHTFGPGDAFTVPYGWRGEYRVTEPLLKQFALYVR